MAISRISFGEWTPDQPGTTNGLQRAENVFSKAVGYGAIQSAVDYSAAADLNLNNVVAGKTLSNQTLIFAGSASKLYKLDSTDLSLDNVSKASKTITTVARTSNITTITTSVAHGYSIGDSVTVTAVSNPSVNGTFTINERENKFSFSSDLVGSLIILEYISDGLAYDMDTKVPKMAEEAMYLHILHSILSVRANTPEYLVQRFKRERSAALRNAKIRLSNIKLEEITQVMRGKSKWIKH